MYDFPKRELPPLLPRASIYDRSLETDCSTPPKTLLPISNDLLEQAPQILANGQRNLGTRQVMQAPQALDD